MFKKKIKRMIIKLQGYLEDPVLKKENLDFLSALKSEVESLIRSVDRFTLSLCKDTSLTNKKLKASKKHGTGGDQGAHFQQDTFNTKYKRHFTEIEKSVNNNNLKKTSVQQPTDYSEGHPQSAQAGKHSKKPSQLISVGGGNLAPSKMYSAIHPARRTETSTPLDRSGDSSQHLHAGPHKEVSTHSELKKLRKEVTQQKQLIEELQKEIGYLKHQNRIIVQQLGLNEQVFQRKD